MGTLIPIQEDIYVVTVNTSGIQKPYMFYEISQGLSWIL
jgi:hypothetical protein